MLSSHVVRASLIQFVHPANASFARAYGLYALSQWIAGMYLFAHFSTSHTHTKVVEFKDHPSWVRYAVEHTVDISPDRAYDKLAHGLLKLPSHPPFVPGYAAISPTGSVQEIRTLRPKVGFGIHGDDVRRGVESHV